MNTQITVGTLYTIRDGLLGDFSRYGVGLFNAKSNLVNLIVCLF
jgi:hypothetical protein